MTWRTFALAGMTMGIVGFTAACDALECGAGTHEEGGRCLADETPCECGPGTAWLSTDSGCECVPIDACPCGPGTVSEPTDGGCQCVPLSPLAGARVCFCMNRPSALCNIMDPGCGVDGYPVQVLATVADGAGGYSLVGGYGTAVPVAGGTTRFFGLQHPFTLDGQPGPVPLAVAADGSFVTDPGARLFTWEVQTLLSQPFLPLRGVSVTGVIDPDGHLDSRGRILGCFTLADAEAIYLEVLTQTLADLIVGSGAVPDCDATGSGASDGYTLDLTWWAGEAVDVYE